MTHKINKNREYFDECAIIATDMQHVELLQSYTALTLHNSPPKVLGEPQQPKDQQHNLPKSP